MKTQHIINALAGTYSLLNTTHYNITNPTVPTGANTQQMGLVTYSANGYVSANFVSTIPEQRPLNLIANDVKNGSDYEWSLIGKYATAYMGPISINTSLPATETQGQVLHGPLFVANLPSLMGKTLVRNYLVFKRDGETYLRLSFVGASTKADVLWKRIA